MTTTPTSPAQRRTQAERSAATIERLHAAAVECLVDTGYARSSTQDICQRAGVSQGALFRHFPSRVAFMISLAEFIGRELVVQFAQRLRHTSEQQPTDIISLALFLARANTRSPLQSAWTELLVAARTDIELQASLQPIWTRNRAEIREEAQQLFPMLMAQMPDFDTAVDVVTMFYQGEAMNHWLNPAGEGDENRANWMADRLRDAWKRPV